ncbi:hypothetical protein [Ornithinibacillus sp. JPR2-1]|uniref:hypothetical protein n=1 Tax=Ornithinibacillus sp. JPR2-1 TaxID=2094019 RepID=UPI0031E06C7F
MNTITLHDKTLANIFTELGRSKFNLSNRWRCTQFTFVGSKVEYTMQKRNRRGNWGQNTIVGYVDMETTEGDLVEHLYYT